MVFWLLPIKLFGYNGSLKHNYEDVEYAVTVEITGAARRLRLNEQGPVIAGKDSLPRNTHSNSN